MSKERKAKWESGNPRFKLDGKEEHAIVGKVYEYKPTGLIVLCIAEDLETFTGLVVKKARKDKEGAKYKVGKKLKDLNTFNTDWWKVEGGIPDLYE